jgi:hypothetical protein
LVTFRLFHAKEMDGIGEEQSPLASVGKAARAEE